MTDAAPRTNTAARFDVSAVRDQFPILKTPSHGRPLAFLDSAASAQKPQAVIDAVAHTYEAEYANIHRGVYDLSERASAAYEAVRGKTRQLINAADDGEIVFTSGTTEGINLIAQGWGRANLGPGDEVLITEMEHHSNIVPWQLLRDEKGIVLKVAPFDDDGALIMDEFEKLLGERTRLVAVTQVSNALGSVLPIADIIAMAHAAGALVLVDGAQGIPHLATDVRALDCDFYAFSGHKLYGPSGTGVLYGKGDLLSDIPPWKGGGDMILSVTFDKTEFAPPPQKFEAGTPNIAGTIGLGAAIDWFAALDHEGLAAHEADLLAYATDRLAEVPGLQLIGTAADKAAVVSFVLDYAHPHDIGTVLDQQGVAVRTGHHCAQPVMDHFDVAATVRASFGAYSNRDDIDALVAALGEVRELFG
ncbi:MAG: cysteine desulfurase [Alphaproteobacteria bacterium]|nr:cysteine desulfurase [Alphaproteobacteria bacterium]